jgi:glycosyltransferase involved in cell wall biosynthesis
MSSTLRVVALIAAFNEEDIIGACLEHLSTNGIDAYLIDDGSTDGTLERATAFLGRGLIGFESLEVTNPKLFTLDRILARKEVLAAELDAGWFINHDADEFRDSLWSELNLRAAIEHVDRLGWNAIDFSIFTIRPVGDVKTARVSPDDRESWYSRSPDCDRVQVRAWKRTGARVDLRSSAGHDVQFEGRRVFPLRFPMRHYPIRSQEHGQRKLFRDRIPRFDPSERARGWHVQYGNVQSGAVLVARPNDVNRYDSTAARIEAALDNRELEAAREELERLNGFTNELEKQYRALEAHTRQVEADRTALAARSTQLDDAYATLSSHASQLIEERQRLLCALEHVRQELDRLYSSRSWRWTRMWRLLWDRSNTR